MSLVDLGKLKLLQWRGSRACQPALQGTLAPTELRKKRRHGAQLPNFALKSSPFRTILCRFIGEVPHGFAGSGFDALAGEQLTRHRWEEGLSSSVRNLNLPKETGGFLPQRG